MKDTNRNNLVVFLSRSSEEARRRLLSRCLRLVEEGISVHLIAGDDGGLGAFEERGIGTTRIPGASGNPAGWLAAGLIVQGALLELRPLMVHAFGHRMAGIAAIAVKQAAVPAFVVTMEHHWLDEDPLVLPVSTWLRRRVPALVPAEAVLNALAGNLFCQGMRPGYQRLGREVSRYLVTSRFDRRLLLDLGLVPEEKLRFFAGGAGVEIPRATEAMVGREAARRSLGLPEHWRQVIGFAGPVHRRHGSGELLDGVRTLRRDHPALGWLVIPRAGTSRMELMALKRWERRGFVRILTGTEWAVDPFRAMDLHLFAGRPSTPVDPVLEAARAGCPTVGFETPATRELVESGRHGHFVFEGQGEELRRGIRSLLSDPPRLEEMGRQASRRVSEEFGRWERDGELVELYAEVLRERLTDQ